MIRVAGKSGFRTRRETGKAKYCSFLFNSVSTDIPELVFLYQNTLFIGAEYRLRMLFADKEYRSEKSLLLLSVVPVKNAVDRGSL